MSMPKYSFSSFGMKQQLQKHVPSLRLSQPLNEPFLKEILKFNAYIVFIPYNPDAVNFTWVDRLTIAK